MGGRLPNFRRKVPTCALLSGILGCGRLVLAVWCSPGGAGDMTTPLFEEEVPDTHFFGGVPDVNFFRFYRILSYCLCKMSSEEVILQGLSRIRCRDSEFVGGT